MAQTVVEKIAQQHRAEGPNRPWRAGDFVAIRPRRVMTHDNTSAVIPKFNSIGDSAFTTPGSWCFPSITTCRTNRRRTWASTARSRPSPGSTEWISIPRAAALVTRSWCRKVTLCRVRLWSPATRIRTFMARSIARFRLLRGFVPKTPPTVTFWRAVNPPRMAARSGTCGRYRGE